MDTRKGVICKIADPEEMPVDADGQRAQIIMAPDSVASRMNIGILHEQYINGASHAQHTRLKQAFNYNGETVHELFKRLRVLDEQQDPLFEHWWANLLGYYQIVSPTQYEFFTSGQYQKPRSHHLAHVIADPSEHIHLYIPPDNPPEMLDIIRQLEQSYPQTYGPVTYRGHNGQYVTTKRKIRIASVYMILLEKTGDDWAAVSSGKLQHFGVLSQVTNSDKYSTPTRTNSIRAHGEAEVRNDISYVGPRPTAELMDRNNNPATHKFMLHSILNADQPTNIFEAVDRNVIPLGGHKALQLIKHYALCGGWKFMWSPYVPVKG